VQRQGQEVTYERYGRGDPAWRVKGAYKGADAILVRTTVRGPRGGSRSLWKCYIEGTDIMRMGRTREEALEGALAVAKRRIV